MNYKDFKIEFVERTISLIDNLSDSTEYEVTLLINCLYAFITVPTELAKSDNRYEAFKPFFIEKLKEYSTIVKKCDDEKLFRTIRNALSHMNIDIGNDGDIITNICFKDKKPNNDNYHTILKFNIKKLKAFIIDIANKYLEISQQIEIIN